MQYEVGPEVDLVIGNIRRRWAQHGAVERRPPTDRFIAVLRTILGSIEKVRAPGPRSQSCRRYIAGFLTKELGISILLCTHSDFAAKPRSGVAHYWYSMPTGRYNM
jgi:hypothetical protein